MAKLQSISLRKTRSGLGARLTVSDYATKPLGLLLPGLESLVEFGGANSNFLGWPINRFNGYRMDCFAHPF